MKIYTKTGDTGQTALMGGGRVPKDSIRVAAYGDVDEANAAIGLARGVPPNDIAAPLLEAIQRDLFAIGGALATPAPAKIKSSKREKLVVPPTRVLMLEKAIDEVMKQLPPLKAFVLPAGTAKAASLHYARTVVRRAERSVVHLAGIEPVPPELLVYLNRLSDLLFALARLANHQAGVPDVAW